MLCDVLIDADPFEGIDESRLVEPPALLLAQCRRGTSGGPIEEERRRSPRYDVSASALVRPIDTGFRASGAAFRGVVADVSATGLRLYHTRYVGAHLLAVRFALTPERMVTVAVSVLRSQPRRGYYEFAGSVLARLDQTGELPL